LTKKKPGPAVGREATWIDAKDRLRWHCNNALAEKLKQLHDFLVTPTGRRDLFAVTGKDHAVKMLRMQSNESVRFRKLGTSPQRFTPVRRAPPGSRNQDR